MGPVADKMPQGKSAMVKNVTSKSAIQKKQNNQKLKAKKLKKAAKKGGARVGGTTDQKSAMFQQRAGDKDDVEAVELTKQINRRISGDLHSMLQSEAQATQWSNQQISSHSQCSRQASGPSRPAQLAALSAQAIVAAAHSQLFSQAQDGRTGIDDDRIQSINQFAPAVKFRQF